MCGGGPDHVTTTTNTTPPSFLVGPLTQAANAASNQFSASQGLPQNAGTAPEPGIPGLGAKVPGLGGQPVPIQPGTQFPGNGNGSGLIPTAQGLTQSTLQGDFLSPDSNPFLASTFNRAADLTQNRLSSEFAGAGRDLGASLPARSEELQTLASNIFGGNFARERGIQQNAITSAQGLDPLNQFINQLAGIIPGAGGVTTSQQPVFNTGLFG